MLDPASLGLFLAAALVLLVTPGPAVLYIVTRSVDRGRSAGLVSVLGIALGSMVHVSAAALGVSALLVRSSTAFTILKYGGAAYLVFLGVRRILVPDTGPEQPRGNAGGLRRVFAQGVWVNVLNPKTALFFFAFLPQFVDGARGSVAAQIFMLGGLFVVMGIVSDGAYALAAGSIGSWLHARPTVAERQRYLTGGILVGLGLIAALSGRDAPP